MHKSRVNGWLVAILVTVVFGCAMIIGLAVSLANPAASHPTLDDASSSLPVTASATPASLSAPTSTVPADVTIISPTVAVGQSIPLPLDGFGTGIKLIRTDATPIIPLEQARQAVYNRNLDWALGGTVNSKTVTLKAAYGLVTLGAPTANGKGWLGSQNIPLKTCTVAGVCVDTGTVLNHIENRPAWVLDYANTDFPAPGPACLQTPCPTPQIFNHSVYTIDALTNSLITADFYTK